MIAGKKGEIVTTVKENEFKDIYNICDTRQCKLKSDFDSIFNYQKSII